MMLYAHPFTFDVHYEERDGGGWTFDCGNKRDYDPTLIRFSCRVWPDGDYTCALMLGEKVLRETAICHAPDVETAKLAVELWCSKQTEEIIAALAASGIEAPSGVETGNTDSTEGESPTAESGDAHD